VCKTHLNLSEIILRNDNGTDFGNFISIIPQKTDVSIKRDNYAKKWRNEKCAYVSTLFAS